MKITLNKVKRKLEKEHGWDNLFLTKDDPQSMVWFTDNLIKDTLKIVDEILKEQKGISIK
jgi:hypothetical protein